MRIVAVDIGGTMIKHFLCEQQYSGIHRHAGKADHGRGILRACRSGE